MDLAYFKHLRYIGDSLDHPILKQLVDVTIDFTMRLQLSGPWISKTAWLYAPITLR